MKNAPISPTLCKDPLVSIVTATYNQAETIAQTLESLLQQSTTFEYEILIGEDCSTDHTLTICQSYQTQYPNKIKIIEHNPNQGIINNYFGLLEMARGKYICDCAGDDYWIDPCKMEKQVNILESNPQIVLVHTNWQELIEESGEILYDSYGRRGFDKSTLQNKKTLEQRLYTATGLMAAHLGTSCYRKEVFENLYSEHKDLFRNPKYTCEDWHLLLALAQKGDFYYLDEESIVYRIQKGSISFQEDYQKQFNFWLGVYQQRLDAAKIYLINPQYVQKYFDLETTNMYMRAFRTQNDNNYATIKSIIEKESYSLSYIHKIKIALLTYPISSKLIWYVRLLYISIKKCIIPIKKNQ